jgi:hypothetical protein
MVKRAGIPIRVVRATAGEAGLFTTLGRTFRPQLRRVATATEAALAADGLDLARLRDQLAPYQGMVERHLPRHAEELRQLADAAGVPYPVLLYLNCGGFRPGPGPDHATSAVPPAPADHCTSVTSRGDAGVLVGHNEDGTPAAIDELYLLDVSRAGAGSATRFIALTYVHTLPGCSAAINEHGLIIAVDTLQHEVASIGVPCDFLTRALLEQPSIDDALELLQRLPSSGGCACLLAQGGRVVSVEIGGGRLAVLAQRPDGAHAHANHYLDPGLAQDAGPARAESLQRCARAQELVRAHMSREDLERLLGDHAGTPASVCRERTLGSFIADSATRRVEVCWGEPDVGAWTSHGFDEVVEG